MPKDNQDEIFVVVNNDDKIISYKKRFECHQNKNLIHRSVGVIIINSKSQIILQKRSKSKDIYPGYFTISVSGHVGKSETYRQAAERELKEELGIITKLRLVKKFLTRMPSEAEYCSLFIGYYDGKIGYNRDEIESIVLATKKNMAKYINKMTPYAKKCLNEYNKITLSS